VICEKIHRIVTLKSYIIDVGDEPTMIDIHTHILPGIDDGADTMEYSLQLARAAVENGIHTIIATPHHANGRYDNPAKEIKALVSKLNNELHMKNISLKVLCGQEVRLTQRLLEDWEKGDLLCLHDSSYMLIEFPSGSIPEETFDFFYELSLHKIKPIIAHPERNARIAHNPELLFQLIEAGALSQITSHSINGVFGSKVQQLAVQLCKRNLVHFVSTDAHHMVHRGFDLQQAYASIERTLGYDTADYYRSNSELIVSNQLVQMWEPVPGNKKWYKFW
jgi:protein-tyrosine phosphatase